MTRGSPATPAALKPAGILPRGDPNALLCRRRGPFWRTGHPGLRTGFVIGALLAGLSPLFSSNSAAGAPAVALPTPLSEDQIQMGTAHNVDTARWMMEYDKVAWATTDLLPKESKETLQRVTPVWFCLQKDAVWYAVYGGLQSSAFDIAVCYRQAAKDKFEKVAPPVLQDADRFARAIDLTLPEILDTTRRTTVRFNYYVRGEKERIAVYYVPAFQPDGKLAYGIQHTLFLDTSGQRVLSHEHYGRVLLGAMPGKDPWITLEMPECAYPTPQAIFTMMSYRDTFAGIVTHCQDGFFGMVLTDHGLTCARAAPPPAPPGPARL